MAANIQKAVSGAAKKEPQTIKDYIKTYEHEVARALPKVMTPERFTRMAMTAVTQTPKLQQCTPQSFIGAMLTAAQLGLEPNTPLGQAYLIPYGNECQFQLGYKGMIDLAHRSGEIKNIEAHVVYENDEFDFEYGLNADIKHKPTKGEKGDPVWVYAIYRLKSGGFGFEVLSWEDCMAHGKKYSKSYNNGPWQKSPEAMAKKTVLKQLLKYAPMASDFVTADESVRKLEDSGEIKVIPEDEIQTAVVDTETGEIIEGKIINEPEGANE